MASNDTFRISGGLEGSVQNLNLDDVVNGAHDSSTITQSHLPEKVILDTGDVIVEYVSSKSDHTGCRWQVSSEDLRHNSPYFRALLDPVKFYEGRQFMQQKTIRQGHISAGDSVEQSASERAISSLPLVKLPGDHFSPDLGIDAVELFLRTLSFSSMTDEEKEKFNAEMKAKPTSLAARLIDLADAFNSPDIVRESLIRSGYVFGKLKSPFWKFDASLLKQSEDRTRQSIFIARFLNERSAFQVFTHTLILLGSRFWSNGVESPSTMTFRWRHLSDGLEEELYYRRQCILNTITDIQAFFLRIYGALEFPEDTKRNQQTTSTTTVPTRHYQCRCGFGNASACDAFHLGQMTRFFALRTKTIFIGSTLLDPDFDPDFESDGEDSDSHTTAPTSPAPSNITTLLSALKQFPDYQIDTHHMSCGVRRRFLPPLDCIERFVGDSRGLLGVDLRSWDAAAWPSASGSWANRSFRRAGLVEVHFSKIKAVHRLTAGLSHPDSLEENARLLFTAKRRNWEA